MEFTNPDTQLRLLDEFRHRHDAACVKGEADPAPSATPVTSLHPVRRGSRLPVGPFAPRLDDALFGCSAALLLAAPALGFSVAAWLR
jgi:hypothetical protein